MMVKTVVAQSFTVSPPSLAWANNTVGTPSPSRAVGIINNGSASFTIQSFSISSPSFQLVDGYAPHLVVPGSSANFNLRFVPSGAGTITGNLILNISGSSDPILVPLSGTASTTTAFVSLSSSSLSFTVSQGSFSGSQQLSITNTGKAGVTLQGIAVDPPFVLAGYSGARIKLNPQASLVVQVNVFGSVSGQVLGSLTMSFDRVPGKTVSLAATVNSSPALAITSVPSLPTATQSGPYLATLTATGGTPPYSFKLLPGSPLPSGLSLAPGGAISGTISSPVALYPFSIRVTDSALPNAMADLSMNLQVSPQTGSNCADISFNDPLGGTPLVPITDLGTGSFEGQQGGLYPGGSNLRPASHDAAGVNFAQSIQPLDSLGNPDPNGKIALISIGMSETRLEWTQFVNEAMQDPSVNPKLVVINGAIDQITARRWADPTDGVWNSLFNFFLPQSGVTANQVVAAWIKDADNFTSTPAFPWNIALTQADLESTIQNLHAFFPNLKLAYLSSRIYGGYANGRLAAVNFEPYAYETGFAVKDVISDQINGNANLNFDPNKGTVRAPWIAWGPYDWANGLLARSDGLVWTCQDIQNDGIHPSVPYGVQKESNVLMNFFKTDTTSAPWFLLH